MSALCGASLLRFSEEIFPASLNTRFEYTLELGGLRYFSASLKMFGYVFLLETHQVYGHTCNSCKGRPRNALTSSSIFGALSHATISWKQDHKSSCGPSLRLTNTFSVGFDTAMSDSEEPWTSLTSLTSVERPSSLQNFVLNLGSIVVANTKFFPEKALWNLLSKALLSSSHRALYVLQLSSHPHLCLRISLAR